MKITKLKNLSDLWRIKNCKGGYAIVELLFYIALFALLTLAVINGMVTMTKAFKETNIQSELLQSGNIIEKVGREIKQAYGINSISATNLILNTKDDAGANKTVEFLLSGTDLQFKENGVLTGNLNTPNISVDGITFTQITTTRGKAVKISLVIHSTNDKLSRSVNFYNTIVLRGDYP